MTKSQPAAAYVPEFSLTIHAAIKSLRNLNFHAMAEELRIQARKDVAERAKLIEALRQHIDATDHGSVSNMRNSTENMRAILREIESE